MTIRVCLYFLLFMASAWLARATEVRLRSSAVCSGTIVRLGDIAEIQTEDPEVAADLSAIALFPASAAGSMRRLNQHEVRQLLTLSDLELDDIAVGGSESVLIQSATGGTPSRPARRNGAAGVKQADFEVEIKPELRPRRAMAESPKPAPESVPLLVARGEVVQVVSRAAGVRITTSGKTQSAGVLGQEIAVELAESRQKVLCRVTGPRSVEVASPSSASLPPVANTSAAAAR